MNNAMIGDDLRGIRLQAKLQQTELAARLNVSQGTVSRIERGVGTTSELLERWAAECGAHIQIARPGSDDPLAALRLRVQSIAEPSRLDLVQRAALALASLPADELEQEARILELRAARHTGQPHSADYAHAKRALKG
jgi:transcriptional regulator with XRE-family HTH domain